MTRIMTTSFQLEVTAYGDPGAGKLALLLPGLLDGRDYPHFPVQGALLAERGYYALAIDPPGTGDSGDDITRYTITNYIKAVNELIMYHGNKPTLLLGHSVGGLVAALAAARNKRVAALISTMAPWSFVREQDGQKWGAGILLEQWQEQGTRWANRDNPADPSRLRHYELPYAFVDDAVQYNALEDAHKLTMPKLFVAGEQDDKITPEQVRQMYEATVEPKHLVLVDSVHDYWRYPDKISLVNKAISRFLEAL